MLLMHCKVTAGDLSTLISAHCDYWIIYLPLLVFVHLQLLGNLSTLTVFYPPGTVGLHGAKSREYLICAAALNAVSLQIKQLISKVHTFLRFDRFDQLIKQEIVQCMGNWTVNKDKAGYFPPNSLISIWPSFVFVCTYLSR